jgi:lipopolysaccharide transport system permease protein
MAAAPTRTVIEPPRGWAPLEVREFLQHRELLYFLTWRDLAVRYKQTALGGLWAVLQPAIMVAVFSVVFHRMAGMPSQGAPYPVFSFAGLLPWLYFHNAVIHGSNSTVANARLMTKIFFPRAYLPVASALAATVDYLIAMALLAVVMAAYGVAPHAELLALPLLLPWTFLAASGLAMLLAALNVRYRDVRHVIPFAMQVWMFLSPVVYSVEQVPANLRWLVALNPMGGLVDAHRAAVLPGTAIHWGSLALSAGCAVLLFAVGAGYFKRAERSFADLV